MLAFIVSNSVQPKSFPYKGFSVLKFPLFQLLHILFESTDQNRIFMFICLSLYLFQQLGQLFGKSHKIN